MDSEDNHPLVVEMEEKYLENYIEKYIELLNSRSNAKHETTIDYYDFELERIRKKRPDYDWESVEELFISM